MMADLEKIAMENVNGPGRVVNVDARKYHSVRDAILAVLPTTTPGLTLADLKKQVLPLLPDDLFPAGAKAGWWLMGVQLDLRAKRMIAVEPSKPQRLHKL
jgi:hypothetical protein